MNTSLTLSLSTKLSFSYQKIEEYKLLIYTIFERLEKERGICTEEFDLLCFYTIKPLE